MTRYIIAVSGGVDSVVLLAMLAAKYDKDDMIVAHFDHGIRPESAADALFVRQLAMRYGVRYETAREELGVNASEELARDRRYAFLRSVAKKYEAIIVTAHHADDVVETVAINVRRGTGWRGLAVLDSAAVRRPLLGMRKSQIIAYAVANALEWREDSTNGDTKYLRNAIRERLRPMTDEQCELMGLYRNRQIALKRLIDQESLRLAGKPPYQRYFFVAIPDAAALELLRMILLQETGSSPMIAVRRRALHAIKSYSPGKRFSVTDGVHIVVAKKTFAIERKTSLPDRRA